MQWTGNPCWHLAIKDWQLVSNESVEGRVQPSAYQVRILTLVRCRVWQGVAEPVGLGALVPGDAENLLFAFCDWLMNRGRSADGHQ